MNSDQTPQQSRGTSPLGCDGSQMDDCPDGRWALMSARVELVLVACKEEKGCNSCVEKDKMDF